MPQDFGQNNAGNSKSMTLNLDALGDVANQAVNMGQKRNSNFRKGDRSRGYRSRF